MRIVEVRMQRVAAGASVWLTVVDEHGQTGEGEATPLPGRSAESVEDVERILAGTVPRMGDFDALDVRGVAEAFGTLEAEWVRAPSARFAAETAVLSLAARRNGVGLSEFLGGARPYSEVPLNALVFGPNRLALARRAAREGFRALKVKLGNASAFDVVRADLARIREELPDVELRLDANGALDLDEAPGLLEELTPLGLRYVEQPVPAALLPDLALCAVPVAADESLERNDWAERLLADGACAVFVLKPALLGLLRSLDIARRAQARGLDVVITHGLDGPIGLAAAAELALSLPRPPLACGLAAHPGLARFPAFPNPQLAAPGFVRRCPFPEGAS